MKRVLFLTLFAVACGEAPKATAPVTAAGTPSVTAAQPEPTTAPKDGARGDVGPKGERGDVGPRGEKGDRGDVGKAGANGTNGAAGEPGANGVDGAVGATGSDGAVGAQGERGATGPQGTTGNRGADGAAGPAGEKGDHGDDGAVGATGAVGAVGAPGATGPAGAVGASGAAGTPALTLKLIDANAADVGQVFWVDDQSGDYWTVKGAMRFEVSRYDGRFPLGYLFYSGLNCTGTLRATIVNGQFANVVQNGMTGQPLRMMGMSLGTFNYQSRMMASTNCQNASGSIDNSWPLETPTLGFGYPVVGAQIDNGG